MTQQYKLVPVEPTPEMLEALRSSVYLPNCYKAMLEVAPEPVQEPAAWRLLDEEASEHYGKPIHVYYDSADIRLDHPDAKRLTALLQPVFTAPPDTGKLLRQALYVIEAWERGCDREDYWRDRADTSEAIRKHFGEQK